MSTKTTISYAYLFSILTIFFASCQDDREIETATTVSPTTEQPDIVVENGLLHFKDQSVWASTVQEMQQTEDYAEYIATLGFENSLQTRYDAIGESDEVLEDYFEAGKLPNVQDDLFASLLNEDAMVKIGQTLYKVTDKHTFSAVDKDGEMLKRFRENEASLSKLSKVNTFENVDHLAGKNMIIEGNEEDVKAHALRFQGEKKYYVLDPQDDNKRVLVGAWSRTYGVYSSVGVKIIAEKYRSGGIFGGKKWRNYTARYLFCFGKTLTQECRPLGCDDKAEQTGGALDYNNNRVQKTIASVKIPLPGAYWHVTDYVEGTYRYIFYEGGPTHETRFTFR